MTAAAGRLFTTVVFISRDVTPDVVCSLTGDLACPVELSTLRVRRTSVRRYRRSALATARTHSCVHILNRAFSFLSMYIFQVVSTNNCMAKHVNALLIAGNYRDGDAVKFHNVELDS